MKKVFYTGLTLAAISLASSCNQNKEPEFVASSFDLGIHYKATDGSNVNLLVSETPSITVPSGTQIQFNYNPDVEKLYPVTAKAEIVRETASGSETSVANVNPENSESPIFNEFVQASAKYSFILTSPKGETVTLGPIEINVTNNQEVIQRYATLKDGEFFMPLVGDHTASIKFAYGYGFTNSKATTLFLHKSGGNSYLVSPSEMVDKGAFSDITSEYNNFQKVDLKPTNNAALINALVNTPFGGSVSYSQLEALDFSGAAREAAIANGPEGEAGTAFIFRTETGKKGAGVVIYLADASVDFYYAYQK